MNIQRKTVTPVKLGCNAPGTVGRKTGATYVVSNMKKWLNKYPWQYFIQDPPLEINPDDFGMSAQGLGIEKLSDGYYHVFDWIGASFYPNPADIIEEAFQQYGSTLTRIEKRLGLLTPGKSKRFLCHPSGYLDDYADIKILKDQFIELDQMGTDHCFLPKGEQRDRHVEDPYEMCAMLHWQHVMPMDSVDNRIGRRIIGDSQYISATPPDGKQMKGHLAIVAWLPIDEFHIVDSPDGDELNRALAVLKDISKYEVFVTNA